MYQEYSGKCIRLYKDTENNYINIEETDNYDLCNIKVVLKEKPELKLDLEENSSGTCYGSLTLKISIKLNDNNIENLKILYKENNEEKVEDIELSDITGTGNERNYYFNIYSKYSDIEVKLKTDYSNEIMSVKPENFPENVIIDKYNDVPNIIYLNSNTIKHNTNGNIIEEIKSNGNITSLSNINNNLSSNQTIEVKDKCGHFYQYQYNIFK